MQRKHTWPFKTEVLLQKIATKHVVHKLNKLRFEDNETMVLQ